MKQQPLRLASINPLNPLLVWFRLSVKTGEMLMASGQVIGHRLQRIAMAGAQPDARDRREFALMGQEKLEASAESLQAVAQRLGVMQAQLGTLAFRQSLNALNAYMTFFAQPAAALSAQAQATLLRNAMQNSAQMASRLSESMARMAHHGLMPLHARATANAKRLGKY